jgi:DNA-binding PadR family transcriptional regulator
MDDKSRYSGVVRLHILHHAAEEPLYGIWIAEELARHGYKLSAGALYPILHGLESKGYLRSHLERDGKSGRRVYRITPLGRRALHSARRRVQELFGEMFKGSSEKAESTWALHPETKTRSIYKARKNAP